MIQVRVSARFLVKTFVLNAVLLGATVGVAETPQQQMEKLIQKNQALTAELSGLDASDVSQAQRKRIAEAIVDVRFEIETLELKMAIAEKLAQQRQRRAGMIEQLVAGKINESSASKPPQEVKLRAGDTVAIYLDGVMPYRDPSVEPSVHLPIRIYPSGQAATGYPHKIVGDGTMRLPLIDPVKIAGLTIRQAEEAIGNAYVEAQILRRQTCMPSITLVARSAIEQ